MTLQHRTHCLDCHHEFIIQISLDQMGDDVECDCPACGKVQKTRYWIVPEFNVKTETKS